MPFGPAAPRSKLGRKKIPYIHIIAGPHIIRYNKFGCKLCHETRRPIFPHHKYVFLGVRGKARKIFHFLFCHGLGHYICGTRKAISLLLGSTRLPSALGHRSRFSAGFGEAKFPAQNGVLCKPFL